MPLISLRLAKIEKHINYCCFKYNFVLNLIYRMADIFIGMHEI